MANIGNGLGSLLSGIAGGAMAGSAIKGLSKKGIAPAALSLVDGGDKAGFGLGGKLVLGALGSSTMAGDSEKSSPWSLLASIIGSNGEGGGQSVGGIYAPGGLPPTNNDQ